MKKYLSLILVFAFALALTACGGQEAEDEGGEQRASGDNVLYVYNYGDYINPEVIDLFEEEYGVTVVYDVYDTPEEMYPVIKSSSVSYDVVCTTDYMHEKMRVNGLLEPLNFDLIPNAEYIADYCKQFADMYDPGMKYTIPYAWGTVGIGYNSRNIPDGELTGWADLWDEKYYDNIMMIDSLRDIFCVGLKYLGYSNNSADEAELRAATDALIEEKELVYKYDTDAIRDFLLNESADIGVIYSGELLYCQEEDEDIHYILPKEGSNVWLDCWSIPANAEHKELAHAWLDFNCRPEISMLMYEYIHYSTPNAKTAEMVAELYPEDLENPALFPDEEALANCEVYNYLGAETEALYNKLWKEIKAY